MDKIPFLGLAGTKTVGAKILMVLLLLPKI